MFNTPIMKAHVLSLLLVAVGFSLVACDKANLLDELPPVTRIVSESLYAETAAERAAQLSNVQYHLQIQLDRESPNFKGIVTINFDYLANAINPFLTIDFKRGSIDYLQINGRDARYSYDRWFISIPAEQLHSGRQSITIAYSHPYATDGSGLHRFVDPENSEVYLFTDFQPYDANGLFPHFDQPDIKATYSLRVTAPHDWQIISSTRETTIAEKGKEKVWDFPQSALFSSYIFSLHAGNYVVWEDQYQDIPLRLFARQSLSQYVQPQEWFEPTKQSFEFFNHYFDIPYPFKKYDQVIVPDFNAGAMENVGAVTFNERYLSRGDKSSRDKMRLANVIAHELAHMWFGNLVTMRWWNGLWLNESFATYMANLALSNFNDYPNTWNVFYSGTKQWAYRSDDSVNTHPIELEVLSTAEALANFDGITYGKGASVLKQLPYFLGEENFKLGVRNYLKKYAYKNTDLEDFINELAKAANRDMAQWTEDWLYTAGLNSIKVAYDCVDDQISEFVIHQTAPEAFPTLREQRVQIGLYQLLDGRLHLTSATPIYYAGAKTDIDQLKGKACPDLVYPNEADWGYVKVDLDQKSLHTVFNYINTIDNPTLRLMLWQTLVDSVNDANLSAQTYANFALQNISEEPDYNVARKIASGLEKSLAYLSTATRLEIKDYTPLYQAIENLYLGLLENAQTESDLQKFWFNSYVAIAKTEQHLALLKTILSEEKVFDGLVIDQDKRWAILATLNRYQYSDYQALLVAEQKRDKSDAGVKKAILAEVLRPQPGNKQKWFDVVINNPQQLKLSTLRYIMYGLFPAEQKALQLPYKSTILATIPQLNSGSDLGLLRAFVDYLLPSQCTVASERELSGLVEQYQAMKPQVLKGVKARHQEVQRCLEVMALISV